MVCSVSIVVFSGPSGAFRKIGSWKRLSHQPSSIQIKHTQLCPSPRLQVNGIVRNRTVAPRRNHTPVRENRGDFEPFAYQRERGILHLAFQMEYLPIHGEHLFALGGVYVAGPHVSTFRAQASGLDDTACSSAFRKLDSWSRLPQPLVSIQSRRSPSAALSSVEVWPLAVSRGTAGLLDERAFSERH